MPSLAAVFCTPEVAKTTLTLSQRAATTQLKEVDRVARRRTTNPHPSETTDVPLLRFDVKKGRSKEQITSLLDATHRAVLTAFGVPSRDRYQVVHEHDASHFIVQDTGLDIARTDNVVVLSVTSRPRSRTEKEAFYSELCRELKTHCQIEPSDVMVTIVTNTDDDWSFGNGRAQFLTGEL